MSLNSPFLQICPLARIVVMLFVFFACLAKASDGNQTQPSAEAVLSSVDNCIMDAPRCKAIALKMQAEQPKYSRAWFRTTYLLLNAMWEIDRLSIPREQIAAYAEIENSPAVFAAKAKTIYAKQLISDGDLEAGRRYADEAAALLLNMSGDALTPRRYADVIELYQYLGEYDQAQQLIDQAMAHFSSIGRAFIKADLLMAAGHNAFHLKQWQQAIHWYQRAAEAHLTTKSFIGAAVSYANVGRALQSQGRWSEAQQAFIKSIDTYEQLQQDYPLRDKYYIVLRLCEVLIEQGKTAEAWIAFNGLQRHSLHGYHHDLYDKLARQLTQNPDR
ncbi:tetratricopeptide repeat protein [Lacimicrobium sp. SS2-24]|uniref:tetratricopeptide repeat protein n=1 Tax=Lacimicrobium sp. SS2-24 TaxID=2005569 RepID=UPI000B4B1D5E|nr:tetratricopeptide repeat protein [Lacimicrobium sp. SS2-24]